MSNCLTCQQVLILFGQIGKWENQHQSFLRNKVLVQMIKAEVYFKSKGSSVLNFLQRPL